MTSNKLIYGGVAVAALFFMTLYFSTDDIGEGDNKVAQRPTNGIPKVTQSATADTTADSYASLQATIEAGIENTEAVERQNKELRRQVQALEKAQEQLTSRIDFVSNSKEESTSSSGVFSELSKAKETKSKNLIKETNLYKPKATGANPRENSNASGFKFDKGFKLNEGLGLSTFGQNAETPNATKKYKKNDPNAGWIMPIESGSKLKNGSTNKTGKSKKGKERDDTKTFQAMTVSDNSVLYNAKTLTYMVGRIPVGGRVTDPYPVKLIVGNETLMANGHSLPGVEGMFFSGYATGDMNLKCVRAVMNSYTYVFEDGRQVTYREAPSTKGSKEPLAYISDRYGLPCVMGEFVSNVAEFLSIQTSLGALSVAGEAYAAAQTTVGTTGLGGSTSTVSGDTGKFVLGSVVSGATEDVRKWHLDRQTNSFDAIVVKSNEDVSLHLNRNISLDYDEAARKIDYGFSVADSGGLD